MRILVVLCYLGAIIGCQANLDLVLLEDPTALCLDGSPGAYYYVRGQDPSTIVLYFQGGAWCGDLDLSSTIENCYQRSKIDYGSSKRYPAVVTFSDGILSDNNANSFKNATRVFLRYCDGSGHQGTRSSPIAYKDTKLYFRGNNITVAQLDDLEKKEGLFSKAKNILVTGGSAGGLAAFMWADYVRGKASTPNVVSAPDSGIFLDFPTFGTSQHAYSIKFENLFKLSNQEIDPPVPDCVRDYSTSRHKCMMVQYMLPYIKTPTFVIQSLYDSWSIENILNIHCLSGSSLASCSQSQRAAIDAYHKKTVSVIEEIMKDKKNGAWGVGCSTHGFLHVNRYYSSTYRVPMLTENSIDFTLNKWASESLESYVLMDGEWPNNKPCSGVNTAKILKRK